MLVDSKDEIHGVHSFVFEPDQPLTWQAGQYMHYILNHSGADDRGVERWFTIAAAPYQKTIRITTRIAVGHSSSFKSALLKLQPGDMVEADGPKGEFVLKEGDFHHVLIAGGIGITPYYAMLNQLNHDAVPAHADLLYANNDDQFVFDDVLADWAIKDPTLRISKIIGRRINQADLKPFIDNKQSVFYLSGPEQMVEGYEDLLPELGVAKDRIVTDFFPGY